jgi:hypothetical protein
LKPPELKVGDTLFGFMQRPKQKNESESDAAYKHSHHSTGSKSKFDEFYTAELRSIVEEKLYPNDVKLWRLVENETHLVSGSELAVKISESCKATAEKLTAHAIEDDYIN